MIRIGIVRFENRLAGRF